MKNSTKSLSPESKNDNPKNNRTTSITEIRIMNRLEKKAWCKNTVLPFEAIARKMESLKKSDFE